jgi:hypothetical protein
MRSLHGTLLLVLLGAVAAALLVTVDVEDATAHDTSQQHGEDYSAVLNHHRRLDWCDRELDGNRVRAWYNFSGPGGTGVRPTDWDPNGSNSGCGHEDPLHCGLCNMHSWQLCEENAGCTNWKGA